MEKIEIPVSGKLTEITKTDRLVLKEAVRRSDGFAMILMHPFYDVAVDHDPETTSLLSDLLQSKDSELPIFIFEDNPSMRNYSGVEKDTGNRSVCIIPTYGGGPHPIIGWDELVDIFKEIGVKDLVMAGKYLNYQEDGDGLADYQTSLKEHLEKQGLKLNKTLTECIGIAGGILVESDFNIHLSELSTPLKLSDFR